VANLAIRSDQVGEVFNIGGGSRITVNSVVKMLEEIIGKDANLEHIEKQKGDVRHTQPPFIPPTRGE